MITLKVLNTEQSKRGLLQIIQDVHMTNNKSFSRCHSEQLTDIRALQACHKDWEHNISGYDNLVYALLTMTLVEVKAL